MSDTLQIDTTDWQAIQCDKCGCSCVYDSTYDGGCFGCFIKNNPEGVPPT